MYILEIVFFISLIAVLYAYLFFPFSLGIFAYFNQRQTYRDGSLPFPRVTIIMIVRNGERYIEDKIKNTFSLDFPIDRYDFYIVSDGSTDRTEKLIQPFLDSNHIIFFPYRNHQGKNFAINSVLKHCNSDIIVFTDVSAMIERGALKQILSWFSDKSIGGVCGRKLFKNSLSSMADAQNIFLSYEDFIRKCESIVGSIASNEGFFYATRRELIRPIPDGVTDDLYTAISVVKQGYRFLFDTEACAILPLRAKKPQSEFQRRRRIVCSSLRGIIMMKELLNPFRYPIYSWILFSHKVLRRFVPFLLFLMLSTNILLLFENHFYLALAIIQVGGYLLFGLMHMYNNECKFMPSLIGNIVRSWYYFVLGNFGTFFGVVDLLTGKNYNRWDPIKEENESL